MMALFIIQVSWKKIQQQHIILQVIHLQHITQQLHIQVAISWWCIQLSTYWKISHCFYFGKWCHTMAWNIIIIFFYVLSTIIFNSCVSISCMKYRLPISSAKNTREGTRNVIWEGAGGDICTPLILKNSDFLCFCTQK